MCGRETSNLWPLRIGEQKRKRKKKKPQIQNIIFASATQSGHEKARKACS